MASFGPVSLCIALFLLTVPCQSLRPVKTSIPYGNPLQSADKYRLRIAVATDIFLMNLYGGEKQTLTKVTNIFETVKRLFANYRMFPKFDIEIVEIRMTKEEWVETKVFEKLLNSTTFCSMKDADIYIFMRGKKQHGNNGWAMSHQKGSICSPDKRERTILQTYRNTWSITHSALFAIRQMCFHLGMKLDYLKIEGEYFERNENLHFHCLKENGIMGKKKLKYDFKLSSCSLVDLFHYFGKFKKFCLPSVKSNDEGGKNVASYQSNSCRDMAIQRICRETVYEGRCYTSCYKKVCCAKSCGTCEASETADECRDYYISSLCNAIKEKGECNEKEARLYCKKTCDIC